VIILLTSLGTDDNILGQGLAIEDFLSRTASQLTYHGLCELNSVVEEEELCVFFRNNHFSTLYKHKAELFILVTDQGFLTEPSVIWETLVNIEGDGQFVNSEYKTIQLESNTVPPLPQQRQQKIEATPPVVTAVPPSPSQATVDSNLTQEDQDYLIALSLQQDRNSPLMQPKHRESGDSTEASQQNRIDSDHALALQLQEEESQQMNQEQQHHQRQPQGVANSPQIQTDSSSQHRNTAQQQQRASPSNNQRNQRGQQDNEKCSIL